MEKKEKTFNEAISRRPFSTKSMFSMFPSPENSLTSRGLDSLSSRSLLSDHHGDQRMIVVSKSVILK